MMQFFSSIGALFPHFLYLIPISGIILYFLYKKDGNAQKKLVGSLFILKKVQKQKLIKKTFFPPLRLFFELLILSLLILGAAHLTLDNKIDKKIIIIDNSLSMSAKLKNSDNLLNLAKKEAYSLINNSLISKTSWRVYKTSPELQAIGEYSTREKALKSIDSIEISYAKDEINSALKQFSDSKARGIFLFTDKETLTAKTNKNINLNLINIAKSKVQYSNIAIQEISNKGSNELSIKVQSFSDKDVQANLTIINSKDKTVLKKKDFELKSLELKTIDFNIDLKQHAGVKAELSTVNQSNDAIKLDNTAWFSLYQKEASVIIVSEETQESLGLYNSKLSSIKVINITDFENMTKTEKSNKQFIFHRLAPSELPESPCLFILPPDIKSVISTKELNNDVEITYWNDTHPLLKYVDLSLLDIESTVPLVGGDFAESVLNDQHGSIMKAGVYKNENIALIAFELFPFNSSKINTKNIIFLNSLSWISNQKIKNSFQTYDLIKKKKSWEEINLNSNNQGKLEEIEGSIFSDTPGIIEINNNEVNIAINFFSNEESNVQEIFNVSLPNKVKSSVEKSPKSQFNKILVYLLLFLLFLDLFLLNSILKFGKSNAS